MVFDLGTRGLFLENDVAHEGDEVENIIFWPDPLEFLSMEAFIVVHTYSFLVFGMLQAWVMLGL